MGGVSDADLFPFHIWKRLHNRYLSKRQAHLAGYVDQGGYRPLCEALSAYLYAARAVRCSPAQVIVTQGTHQSLDLVAKLLGDPGTPCGSRALPLGCAGGVFGGGAALCAAGDRCTGRLPALGSAGCCAAAGVRHAVAPVPHRQHHVAAAPA
ncbi:hypothetical protein NWF32_22000 [Pseudomonas qingdaonensis]|nr:hypothetical protein [Pseudomonas qingdaonensis]